MTALPVAFHELVVAPVAVGLAFLHARRALGTRRAAGELTALALYGFALERTAISVFASHTYGEAWRLAPLGVPLAVAGVWAAVISSAMAVAARVAGGGAPGRALAAALVGVSLDLLMEPVAVRAGLWAWTPPGAWLGVPVGNFVGWAVIVATYTAGAERWARDGGPWAEALRRAALGAGSILALVAVGLVWTRAGAEGAFEGPGGWVAWAVMLSATLALPRRRAAPSGAATLGLRLGAPGGRLPASVLLLLAGVFAVDAFLLGGAALAVVAAGSLGVLGAVGWRASQ